MITIINILLILTALGLAFTSGYILAYIEISAYLKKLKKTRKENENDIP